MASGTISSQQWAGLVKVNGSPEWTRAFAADARLEASVLPAPLRGAEDIGAFFRATSVMYERIAFEGETAAGRKSFIEWRGRIFGDDVAGVTMIETDAAGRIVLVALHHRPLAMVTRFAARLQELLSGGA